MQLCTTNFCLYVALVLQFYTQITFDFARCELQHLFCQRWLHPNPEGVVHYVVGVGQVATDTVVGALQIWLSGEVAGKE